MGSPSCPWAAVRRVRAGHSCAFGGSFYLFTTPNGHTEVTKVDAVSYAQETIGIVDDTIVGASVVPCMGQE